MRRRTHEDKVDKLRKLSSRAYLDHALKVQAIELHPRTRRVWIDGREMRRLGPMEAALLAYLMERPGQVVSREDLLSIVWGYPADVHTNTVDATLKNLRRKLGDDWRQPRFITTVWARGLRFEPESTAREQNCA